MPLHVHVIDTVGADGNPGDQGGRPQVRVHLGPGGDLDILADLGGYAAASGQCQTGTRPARDTRFGSSNDARILDGSCHNRIRLVFSRPGTWKFQPFPSFQLRGIFRVDTTGRNHIYAVDEANPA